MSQAQPFQPTFINLPQPSSNPDTPSEMPGTPTSTTTSLSALSTTAIKDGQRGSAHHAGGQRGHSHHGSTTSLEAERADRISRLAGLSNVQTLRVPPGGVAPGQFAPFQPGGQSPQTTPTSTGFPGAAHAGAGGMAPAAYFDAAGQPMASTKMSTVGTASATDSLGARTLGDSNSGANTVDADMLGDREDEDLMSMDTNYRGTEQDSTSGYMGAGPGDMDDDMANRSVGAYEDRMSDDGTGSLVGFGEGAGSTVSGPIYHRRPLPGQGQALGSSASAMGNVWKLERSSSGMSDGPVANARREREREAAATGSETPISASAAMEQRAPRITDGMAMDVAGGARGPRAAGPDDVFVDSTAREPLPAHVQPNTSAIRETQQPHSFQQQQQQGQQQAAASREAVERMQRENQQQSAGGLGGYGAAGR